MKLSVVIITKNEEANLPRCLDSVRFADQVIVVDSHSTDRTVEIARQCGTRVETTEWQGFGKAKQKALSLAEGEWVLSIDADEQVSAELASEIQSIIMHDADAVGYEIPRLTNFLGRWIRHCGWYPDPVLRLFRRGRGKFTDDLVHERVLVDGPVGRCRHDLLHYSYPTLDVFFEKFNRYTTEGAVQEAARGRRAGIFDLTIRPFVSFIKHYISKAGFLDGVEGFLVSALSSSAVFVKYAKLRQLNREADNPRRAK
jgi:glycosyltransferase involved in cell wall biosynthesis